MSVVDPWVNRENFDRIQLGMTMDVVEGILGGPGEEQYASSSFGDGYIWYTEAPMAWSGEPGNVVLRFQDGVVTTKACTEGLP